MDCKLNPEGFLPLHYRFCMLQMLFIEISGGWHFILVHLLVCHSFVVWGSTGLLFEGVVTIKGLCHTSQSCTGVYSWTSLKCFVLPNMVLVRIVSCGIKVTIQSCCWKEVGGLKLHKMTKVNNIWILNQRTQKTFHKAQKFRSSQSSQETSALPHSGVPPCAGKTAPWLILSQRFGELIWFARCLLCASSVYLLLEALLSLLMLYCWYSSWCKSTLVSVASADLENVLEVGFMLLFKHAYSPVSSVFFLYLFGAVCWKSDWCWCHFSGCYRAFRCCCVVPSLEWQCVTVPLSLTAFLTDQLYWMTDAYMNAQSLLHRYTPGETH